MAVHFPVFPVLLVMYLTPPLAFAFLPNVCPQRYADEYKLRDMLRRYSSFITFPIDLWSEKTDYAEVKWPFARLGCPTQESAHDDSK